MLGISEEIFRQANVSDPHYFAGELYRKLQRLKLPESDNRENEYKAIETLATVWTGVDIADIFMKKGGGPEFVDDETTAKCLRDCNQPSCFNNFEELYNQISVESKYYFNVFYPFFSKNGYKSVYKYLRSIQRPRTDEELETAGQLFRYLYTTVNASRMATDLSSLTCLCYHCGSKVIHVFCCGCYNMVICSTCFDENRKNGGLKCPVCRKKQSKYEYGYNCEEAMPDASTDTSGPLYAESVRKMCRFQKNCQYFHTKNNSCGLINCAEEGGDNFFDKIKVKKNGRDNIKNFKLYMAELQMSTVNKFNDLDTHLIQSQPNGMRLCDLCREQFASCKLAYVTNDAKNKKIEQIKYCVW